jgi:hypothetical protein
MKTVCAWCCRIISDGPEEPASHGICTECARNWYQAINSEGYTGRKEPAPKVKVVCPWCDKVIAEGPENSRTYKACAECEKIFMDEFVIPYCRYACECRNIPRRLRHNYVEEFHDPAREHLEFVVFVVGIIGAVFLASVALNYLTGGWVPNLIQWAVDHPAG